jgi:hypothetical protein
METFRIIIFYTALTSGKALPFIALTVHLDGAVKEGLLENKVNLVVLALFLISLNSGIRF